jgi:hypothetical protein
MFQTCGFEILITTSSYRREYNLLRCNPHDISTLHVSRYNTNLIVHVVSLMTIIEHGLDPQLTMETF